MIFETESRDASCSPRVSQGLFSAGPGDIRAEKNPCHVARRDLGTTAPGQQATPSDDDGVLTNAEARFLNSEFSIYEQLGRSAPWSPCRERPSSPTPCTDGQLRVLVTP